MISGSIALYHVTAAAGKIEMFLGNLYRSIILIFPVTRRTNPVSLLENASLSQHVIFQQQHHVQQPHQNHLMTVPVNAWTQMLTPAVLTRNVMQHVVNVVMKLRTREDDASLLWLVANKTDTAIMLSFCPSIVLVF